VTSDLGIYRAANLPLSSLIKQRGDASLLDRWVRFLL
jgi:hypothetical protein